MFGIDPVIIFLGTRLVVEADEPEDTGPVPKLIGIGAVRL